MLPWAGWFTTGAWGRWVDKCSCIIDISAIRGGQPVFGNHRNHGRDRFTLRGQAKVNVQWNLYSIVHNMGKIHVYGEGFT
jgi:hypothetical protein